MSIRLNNIILNIDEEIDLLKDKAAKKLKISKDSIKNYKILRESIDARRKDNIKFNYTLEVETDNEEKLVKKLNDKDVKFENNEHISTFPLGTKKLKERPIIVGMGPAGMFAGLLMARNGYRPIIIERGQNVDERTKSVENFWNTGKLDINSNVQFGEGGAGTFSDGKLTTRIKDPRCSYILETFVKYGAPKEIIYSGKPHVGTDILKDVVKNIRKEIISFGGEIRFNSTLEDLIIKDGKLVKIVVNGETLPCTNLILAIGHSSRDTYEMLYKRGIDLTPKPFAIGVRIEHLQSLIDESQYGKFAGHKRLKAADYKLTHISEKTKRAVYSFCMCPGGEVVAAASEEGRLVTNGMSYYKRDKINANSALVVAVSPDDFKGTNPLKGMEFQRYYESLAYNAGGGGYKAPIQLVGDFFNDRVSKCIKSVVPTYKPGYEFKDLRECLPSFVIESLKDGLINFDKKIKGFAHNDVVLTGIETRTSAPIRIQRGENFQSISLKGLYPTGEGAGYAGGIMSAAADGLRVAEIIMKEWAPFN
ncbi:NAD(P)/FAD-dependent oxidoreductase [Clostridium prolinivorans]|uniref:NAD(P)/FAD-dependent oxidoreductase n=1 Tax=Clostridium prolinivorans TaxID=2769420 RepID=UPI000FDAD9F5|nr:NAD(P)/FAD-dependent oxidoreductase [Clostridium prolinivorans]